MGPIADWTSAHPMTLVREWRDQSQNDLASARATHARSLHPLHGRATAMSRMHFFHLHCQSRSDFRTLRSSPYLANRVSATIAMKGACEMQPSIEVQTLAVAVHRDSPLRKRTSIPKGQHC